MCKNNPPSLSKYSNPLSTLVFPTSLLEEPSTSTPIVVVALLIFLRWSSATTEENWEEEQSTSALLTPLPSLSCTPTSQGIKLAVKEEQISFSTINMLIMVVVM